MTNSYEKSGEFKTTTETQRENSINNAVKRLALFMPEEPLTEINSEKETAQIVRPGEEGYYEMEETPSRETKSERPQDITSFFSGETQKVKKLKERLGKILDFYGDATGDMLNQIDSAEKLEKLEADMTKEK